MAEAAARSSKPIAVKTRLDRTFPDEQADPAEIAKPARSICITCVSPFHPGVTMHEVLGSRRSACPTKIVSFARASRVFSRIFLSFSTRSQTPFSNRGSRRSSPKSGNPDQVFGPRPAPHLLPAAPDARFDIERQVGAGSARRFPSAPRSCAETSAISTPDQSKRAMGSFPIFSASSRCRPAPRGRSCKIPVSEFAACMRRLSARRIVSKTDPTVTLPVPRPRYRSSVRTQALKNRVMLDRRPVTAPAPPGQRRRFRRARDEDDIRRLRAHGKAATCARARSINALAARPSAWTEDGLPTTSIAAIIASRASARSGIVAL
jgi:hypothetical protein